MFSRNNTKSEGKGNKRTTRYNKRTMSVQQISDFESLFSFTLRNKNFVGKNLRYLLTSYSQISLMHDDLLTQ